ncbi:MAG TPA: glutamate synthase large subunit [Kiritimatiellia bacterium]|nr:glutamate synthase large subunit [Kiritimatiellia bacterium]HPS09325.1 glutamate synthase large subunit [Kiritimatiellia bacterium]
MTKNSAGYYPESQGLYDPAFEKDACGVGMVCSLRGEKSHDIVAKALKVLANLEHRGATGYDPETGDGAGILLQVPHAFFSSVLKDLPAEGSYGVGMVFLPQNGQSRKVCEAALDQHVKAEGLKIHAWRDVPVRPEAIGELGRGTMPFIRQVFVTRGKVAPEHLDRHLFIARKLAENEIRSSGLDGCEQFYLPSLSSKLIVYKGLMRSFRVAQFYPDLESPLVSSALALVHQRYSTNTFPAWPLAQPFRFISHNGEINTLRGNMNWMKARQGLFESELLGTGLERLFPILTEGASDSAILDNAIELLYHAGRSLPHAVMMLIPEAWHHHTEMSPEKQAFYEYHACLMEPWDGPASIPFTDGQVIGAVLDRNGLRPSRYTVTKDGLVILASETGVLEIDPANVERKGRLQPGRMFLVDTQQGRIVDDEEIKAQLSNRKPYGQWLARNLMDLDALSPAVADERLTLEGDALAARQRLFGYSVEDLKITLAPMGRTGVEPMGSMGNDAPLAVLSSRPRLFFDYFHQLFAQVTNPPLDAIREELVTSLLSYLGKQGNLLAESPELCRLLRVRQPILTESELVKIRNADNGVIRSVTLPSLFAAEGDGPALKRALDELCSGAEAAVGRGKTFLILSDRGANGKLAPMPSLLAVSAVHQHLVRRQLRAQVALVVDAGDPREVHHFATLIGFGADAVCPYMAYASLRDLCARKLYLEDDPEEACAHFIKAVDKGLLKVMSKMGISTLQSYRGAQIFEIVGLNGDVTSHYFAGTVSRVQGIGLEQIAEETLRNHASCFGAQVPGTLNLPPGGIYQWRRDGETHLYNPGTIALLQQAVQKNDAEAFQQYVNRICGEQAELSTLRGLLKLKKAAQPVPLEEVEPWTAIVKRFKTGAMSYGSISRQAHETLAIAMNRIGGSSNSGEGGEAPERFRPDAEGNWRISMIKQVASGRFGVTSHYLVNARELQIKMAQGAKPGEGGQLPAEKVYPWIAETRLSTPYVQLISPPPHHDIYSIEDLAQLIHDLKNANPAARISVKLVSEAGVGTVAAGVAKGKADLILISGWDGGTGASPMTAVKHAGLPWELGLAEAHQTLLLNKLRDRVRLECDGKLMCGRDVAVACLLGAEEFGFATAPLVTMGCVMMRVCHLNTCPQGIATQDPRLSKKFAGKPEYVVNFMRFIAEDFRRVMAEMGFRTVDEMVGRTDLLEMQGAITHWKAKGLDYSSILRHVPSEPTERRCTRQQDHGLGDTLDRVLIQQAEPALEGGQPVRLTANIRNVNRTIGTMLSSVISKKYGADGLPEDAIWISCKGTCGQSFGAFGAHGLTLAVEGDANDYFGKGLSGGKLILYPPANASFAAEKNMIVGNVALYGATHGEAYIRGLAGERFCVRNSGAHAVVEGVGDHGCEYMTGGRVVVLGPTGRNFAAGMSGGIAYVLDESGAFAAKRCNRELVDLEELSDPAEIEAVSGMIRRHREYTGSPVAQRVINEWYQLRSKFVKIMPRDYKRALARLQREEAGTVTE